jgi:hypothetical protein
MAVIQFMKKFILESLYKIRLISNRPIWRALPHKLVYTAWPLYGGIIDKTLLVFSKKDEQPWQYLIRIVSVMCCRMI